MVLTKRHIKNQLVFFIFCLSISMFSFAQQKENKFAVTFDEEDIFFLSKDLAQKNAQERAEEATRQLSKAVDIKKAQKKADPVKLEKRKDHYIVYVLDSYVASLFKKDADYAGAASLDEYAAKIKSDLNSLVEDELIRQQWQSIALKIFLSIIMAFLGFFLLRQLKLAFDKLEQILISRKQTSGDISFLGVPLLRNESVPGLLAFIMEFLRWVSYFASILVVFITILSQFETSRSYLRLLGKSILKDLVQALQSLTLSLPGVLLGLLILLSLHIGLHAFNLMLRGLKRQKIRLKSIPSHRIPVFKTVVPFLAFALIVPLAIAAFFQRYNTPMQWIVVGASLIAILGSIPIFSNWLSGILILWRNELKEGDWVSIHQNEGEIASINPIFVHLVPLDGGIVFIPMLKVLLFGVKKFPKEPTECLEITFKRIPNIKEEIEKLREGLAKDVKGILLKPKNIFDKTIVFHLLIPISHHDIKEQIIYKLLNHLESSNLELMDRI